MPDSAAPDKWKLEQNEMLADGITFNGGEKLTLKKTESWPKFLKDGVLTFYMPRKCKWFFITIPEQRPFPTDIDSL